MCSKAAAILAQGPVGGRYFSSSPRGSHLVCKTLFTMAADEPEGIRQRLSLRTIDPQPGAPRKKIKFPIVVKDCHIFAHRGQGDQAVGRLANGFPLWPALAEESGRTVMVCGCSSEDGGACRQSPRFVQLSFVAGTSRHFHTRGVKARDVSVKQFVGAIAHPGIGVPKKKLGSRGAMDPYDGIPASAL